MMDATLVPNIDYPEPNWPLIPVSEEIREAYLLEAKRHHPDAGGSDPAHFQAIHEAYEAAKKLKLEEMKKSKKTADAFEDEEASEVHISSFGPSKSDFSLAGDDNDFQSRKADIYKALRAGSVTKK